jgi:hypothetical protein
LNHSKTKYADMMAYPQAQAQATFSEVLENVIKLSG